MQNDKREVKEEICTENWDFFVTKKWLIISQERCKISL